MFCAQQLLLPDSQRLAETSTTGAQIGTLYQSGIYTDVTSTDKLLNYQGTM